MGKLIPAFLATGITAPILVYFIIFVIGKKIMQNHRKAVQLAIDVSTIFFIFSVHILLVTIWERSFLSVIFIFMLSYAIIFVIIHWKVKGEIIFIKIFRGFWRFSFLIFMLAYFGLTIFGVIEAIQSNI